LALTLWALSEKVRVFADRVPDEKQTPPDQKASNGQSGVLTYAHSTSAAQAGYECGRGLLRKQGRMVQQSSARRALARQPKLTERITFREDDAHMARIVAVANLLGVEVTPQLQRTIFRAGLAAMEIVTIVNPR